MNKKAYYFMIDALVATFIFTVGYFLLTSYYSSTAPSLEIKRVSEDIMSLMSEVKLTDICDDTGCTIEGMESIYNIVEDKNNTLLEAIGELYSKNMLDKAAEIVKIVIVDNNLIPRDSNFTLSLDDGGLSVLIYPEKRPFNLNARVVIPAKKVIFGLYY